MDGFLLGPNNFIIFLPMVMAECAMVSPVLAFPLLFSFSFGNRNSWVLVKHTFSQLETTFPIFSVIKYTYVTKFLNKKYKQKHRYT